MTGDAAPAPLRDLLEEALTELENYTQQMWKRTVLDAWLPLALQEAERQEFDVFSEDFMAEVERQWAARVRAEAEDAA